MIRSRRVLAAAAVSSAVVFGSGRALAGDATPGRINDEFFFDDEEPGLGGAAIAIEDNEFAIEGSVSGVGTDGDVVRIVFFTPLPTNANADEKQGRVRQSRFSLISFEIASAVDERDLALSLNPEKCAIDGKVDVPKDEGQVTVRCSGTNIYAGISASQEASIQAAFQGTKKVKIKVSNDGAKGSLEIRLKGPLLLDTL